MNARTEITGSRFDSLALLSGTLGAWEHPHLGRMVAERLSGAARSGDTRVCVQGQLGQAVVERSTWMAYFRKLDFGPDGWRRGHSG